MPKIRVEIRDSGIIFRGWSEETKGVDEIVERLDFSVERACEIGFKNIVVLIPKDKDCGVTYPKILKKILNRKSSSKMFVRSPIGNESSDVINEGLALLRAEKSKIAFIVSNKAVGYLNKPNVEKMLTTFDDGAFVSGLALRNTSIHELEDHTYRGILVGRISNIFAAWHLDSLDKRCNFDSKIGVEEIAPIVRLIKENSVCIAPVIPTEGVGLNISPLRSEHFAELSRSKIERQLSEAKRAGGTFQLIEAGIIIGYPQ